MKLRYSLASLLVLLTLVSSSAAIYVWWINRPDFSGKVLERQEDSVLVAVEAAKFYDTDRVWVHLPESIGIARIQEGSLIKVWTNGMVMQSYPPQVVAIRVAARN